MKKQFQIFINENEKYIIDLNENEHVSIGVLSNSVLHKSDESPEAFINIDGNRWRDGEMDLLAWKKEVLNTGDEIKIKYKYSEQAPTEIHSDELYVKPEEECSFCFKKKSEVKVLIAAKHFCHICNECVQECMKLVNEHEKT